MAYCVAAALLEGRVALEQFAADRFGPDGVREPAIAALLSRDPRNGGSRPDRASIPRRGPRA